MSKASLEATKKALDAAAKKHGFHCLQVSWEDAQRGTVGGALSCWGGNISDVRLWEKSGTLLYTLRTNNWNERLGYVASKDVAVVVGNHVPTGQQPTPITLQKYLKGFKEYASYAGATVEQLWDETADQLLSIRFQAVFLPIADKEVTEFCTEVYNYNSHSDDDPRNTLLFCTAQGTNVQQDGAGAQRLFLHTVDKDNTIHRYWLEAERSSHKVGGAQKETDEEAAEAAARGKATAIHIGTKAMGTRFNVQMMIQLPVKQKERPAAAKCYSGGMAYSSAVECEQDESDGDCGFGLFGDDDNDNCSAPLPSASAPKKKARSEPVPTIGVANAARVSRGTEHDTWGGISNTRPVRDPSQHGTITVTLYYTVAGGIPSVKDVEACVADLDALYKACPSDKKLVDCGEITKELTVKAVQDIAKKITTQPYVPQTFPPTNSMFPTDD